MRSPGERIADRYILVEQIGEGGMGRVFRALDETLSRDVAVKILLPQYAVDESARKRFIREAKVTANLSHPSAIAVFDFGAKETLLFLVMELLTGQTLRRALIDGGPLSLLDAIDVATKIADVLVSAHALPLIHRDLKPENIMVSGNAGERAVKVLDFGMAFIAEDEGADARGMGRLTREGLAGGTPMYMSPEQVQGAKLDGGADVYALGCVLFEMLAGDPPFDGPMMKVLTKQLYQPAPDLRPLCPEAPQALVELVARMLVKRAVDRPGAATVHTRLEAIRELVLGGRERSRDESFLSGREGRMVTAPHVPIDAAAAVPSDLRIVVRGELDADVLLALAATGITIATDERGSAALLVADLAATDIEEVCAESDCPVVVACENTAIDVIAALVRAGVAEVVALPLNPEELTRKLRRAARKKR